MSWATTSDKWVHITKSFASGQNLEPIVRDGFGDEIGGDGGLFFVVEMFLHFGDFLVVGEDFSCNKLVGL